MSTIPVTDPHKAWNVKQFKRLEAYNARLQKLLDNAIKKAAAIALRHDAKASDEHLFSFSDDRQMKAEVDKLMKELSAEMTSFIKSAEEAEWKKAYEQAAAYIGALYKTVADIKELQERSAEAFLTMRTRNLDALEAFRKRKIGGLSLSKKVWNYTQDFGRQMEVAIDTALMQGKSAAALSRDIRSLLTDPNALFRRVRDENDQLRMSKAMEAYHPGTGRYRSAYKNAMRLASSEINMAYRASDCNVAMMSDDCVGIEIHLSNNHNCKGVPKGEFYDICDQLAGRYPKGFNFTGWHPQCRCFITYVLKTDEEHRRDIMTGTNGGSVNTVKDVPDNFKEWVKDNEGRIEAAEKKGTAPYFLKDNEKYWKEGVQKGLNSDLGHKPTKHGEMFEAIDMKKAKLSVEQETNLSEIARKAGFSDEEIKAMNPMSFSDADGGSVNSLTGKNDNTRDNCQSCAPVFELRCRGVDVTAKGYVEGGFAEKLSNDQTLAYITSDGKKPSLTAKFSDADSLLSYLGGSEMAKNGRYQLGFDRWMNSNDGHILNIICVDGKRYLYDGQSNLRLEISDIINRIDFSANVGILRVDKLLFSSEITNILMRL